MHHNSPLAPIYLRRPRDLDLDMPPEPAPAEPKPVEPKAPVGVAAAGVLNRPPPAAGGVAAKGEGVAVGAPKAEPVAAGCVAPNSPPAGAGDWAGVVAAGVPKRLGVEAGAGRARGWLPGVAAPTAPAAGTAAAEAFSFALVRASLAYRQARQQEPSSLFSFGHSQPMDCLTTRLQLRKATEHQSTRKSQLWGGAGETMQLTCSLAASRCAASSNGSL